MPTVGKLTINGTTHLIASTAYGTCSTAADTAAKVATIQDSQAFTLLTGVLVFIKMSKANSAANPTLNVNNTGNIAIKRYGTTAPSTSTKTSWNAGSVVPFVYDGTYWQIMGWLNNDTTYSSREAAQGGTNTSLCTDGEKFVWNNKAESSHSHGNIQNSGALQTSDVAIANGDKLVITDASDSNKVARSSASFDGSTTTKFLSQKGTFETPSVTITENTTFNISGTTFKIELVS